MGDMLYRASQDTGAKQNTCMQHLSSLTLHLEHLHMYQVPVQVQVTLARYKHLHATLIILDTTFGTPTRCQCR